MTNNSIAKLFKQYDVRGTYPTLNAPVAYWVARTLASQTLQGQGPVALMHDTRLSSPELYRAAYRGLQDAGVEVIPLALGSTDMLYAACMLHDCAGIMITASHNPAPDNGMKIVRAIPHMVGLDSGLDIIRNEVLTKVDSDETPQEFAEVPVDEAAQTKVAEYFRSICQTIVPKLGKLKIVADGGNGMGGAVMRRVIASQYPEVEWIDLFWDLDGRFPNRGPDPSKYENLEALCAKVRETGADFGVAFDGDADRAFFVDEQGEIVHADFISGLIAESLLEQDNSRPLITPMSSSRVFEEVAADYGTNVIRTPQGHTYVKAAMLEHDGLFGGEYSGHFYFREFHNMDSGALAIVVLASLLNPTVATLSERVAKYREKYFITPSINILVTPEQDFEAIKAALKQAYVDAEHNELDGLTVSYPDWKFNLRASNTEPKLRLVVECIGADNLEEKVQEVQGHIAKV